MFGCAELMMGANHIRVRCFDGVTRLGRIKGKIKKKVWIREGDIPLLSPRETFRMKNVILFTGIPARRSNGSVEISVSELFFVKKTHKNEKTPQLRLFTRISYRLITSVSVLGSV